MRQQLKRVENRTHRDDSRLVMKSQLIAIVAAVLMVGCCTPAPEPPPAKAPDISIHDAAREGNIEAVKQHIAAGTDLEAKDDGFGTTPLHYAAKYGRKETVELLIAKGADVNAKDDEVITALHYAAGDGHKEVVELLIAKGAEVNAKDKRSFTPLDAASTRSHPKTADLLRKHGSKTGEELKAEGK